MNEEGKLAMNVSLTPELEEIVSKKVESGMYHSASEVIREGLRLLVEQDTIRELRLQELRKQIAQGFEQIERGEYVEYTSATEFADDIKAEGRRLLSKRREQGGK